MFFSKSSDFGNRGYYSGALSVPYVANGGVYGYCWCSSSAAICQFYGYSTTPTDVHIIGHGTSHTLNYCPGGSPSEAYSAIHAITSKTGNVDMQGIRNNAPNVKSSIDSGIPVYSSWGYYSGGNRIGHAMVICGYTYHDSTGVFTYKIMDPNNTSYRYVYSTYNASSITCLVGTNTYTWEYSIYDFQ